MNKIAMIAAAGRGSRMMSLTDNNPKAMLPFNSKPIIGHHLDYLIENGYEDVVIIVGYQKDKLINYVNSFYKDRINVKFAYQRNLNGLAGALYCGLLMLTPEEKNRSLLILLGDIILNTKVPHDIDFVGYDTADDWLRWCLLETDDNGSIIDFIDKPQEKPETNKKVMGVYNILNIPYFELLTDSILSTKTKVKDEYQISQVLQSYIRPYDVKAIKIEDYYDLGDLDSLNNTRKNISRHFNNIKATNHNTVIKSSEDIDKMNDEAKWFEDIPRNLSIFTPHLVDKNVGSYELEFIHSSPLQELYLFNLPEKNYWVKIFKTINRFIAGCKKAAESKHTPLGSLSFANKAMLYEKTLSRARILTYSDFNKRETVNINGVEYKNPLNHLDHLLSIVKEKFVNKNSQSEHLSFLHGDLFFGNMLYDVNTDVLKVIDPRGSYGHFKNMGDIRYDIAKLNHSINGYYDFIINGLYFLEKTDGKYVYSFYESKQDEVQKIFQEVILKDYDKDEIDLLTGLLFLTMIPLHSENPKNQNMQFIKATEFLNKFL